MKKNWTNIFFLLGLLFFLLPSEGWGQEYYWTFEGKDGLKDVKKGQKVLTQWQRAELATDPDGRGYLQAKSGYQNRIQLCQIPPQRQFSMEFLLRYDVVNEGFSPQIIAGGHPSFYFHLNTDFIGFHNVTESGKGVKSIYTSAKLRGIDRQSLSYYFDQKWHHIAIVFDGVKGEGFTYVDGVAIAHRTDELKGLKMGKDDFSISISPKFVGHLDDIAIHFRPLTQQEVAKHAAASLAGKPYGSNVRQRNFPPVRNEKNIGIDAREYPPQHPQVEISPYEQLDQFPFPRYKADHGLMPLFNWMGIPYIGGFQQEGTSLVQSAKNTAALTELMADKYHYYLVIPNSKEVSIDKPLENQYVVLRELIELANRRKDLPLSVISLWLQTNMKLIGEKKRFPFVARKDLPDSYYMRNTKGEFLMPNGVPSDRIRWFTPAAPGFLFKKDGLVQQMYFKHLLELLDRPIDIVNENGETAPHEWLERIQNFDPAAKAHFEKSGIKDWDSYAAQQKLRFRKYYSDQFMEKIPELKNTLFTWYGVDAGPFARFQWKNSRYIHSKINGQYYSTPDFYPRNPNNWRKWSGPWRGWEWVVRCREIEITEGDKLFSPFIGAGWEVDPEKNIRPSQWLGLLKLMGPIGAEFFYTGFFNETPWKNQGKTIFPHPKNYIWQAAIPSYVQALTSHYEDVLRNGHLLKDEKGKPMVHVPINDPRMLVTLRKAKDKKRYIIAGAILPSSNLQGQVPEQGATWVPIEGKKYKFNFRRQGSVYDLDLSASTPVIKQLDSWHETGHPLQWSKDLFFEAELFDQAKGVHVHSDVRGTKPSKDFTNFSSFACSEKGKATLTYHFALTKSINKLNLSLLARNVSMKKNSLKVWINGKEKGKIDVKQQNWRDYKLVLNERISKGDEVELTIEMEKEGLEIDSFTLQQP